MSCHLKHYVCLNSCTEMSVKSPISTHILDTTKGQPAAGVNVTFSNQTAFCFSLSRSNDFQWIFLRYHCTNSSMAIGCWLMRVSPIPMVDAVIYYYVKHIKVDAINCILPLKNILKAFKQQAFIRWLRFSSFSFFLDFHFFVDIVPFFGFK